MNEDDIISQILNEDTQNSIEYNKNDYNINEVIDSLDKVKDFVDSNDLSNTKLLEKKKKPKEKNKEVPKGDLKEAKEDDTKKNKTKR